MLHRESSWSPGLKLFEIGLEAKAVSDEEKTVLDELKTGDKLYKFVLNVHRHIRQVEESGSHLRTGMVSERVKVAGPSLPPPSAGAGSGCDQAGTSNTVPELVPKTPGTEQDRECWMIILETVRQPQ